MMIYKGYMAEIEFDYQTEILFGRVTNINDIITFQADNIESIRQEFHNSVDDYLAFCKEINQEPNQPFLGQLIFQTTPEHHRQFFLAAQKAGKNIEDWMDEVLMKAASQII